MSKKYSLNIIDLESIAKGATIALLGALLTYLAQVVGNIDFGTYTPIVVAIAGIIINVGRKYLSGTQA